MHQGADVIFLFTFVLPLVLLSFPFDRPHQLLEYSFNLLLKSMLGLLPVYSLFGLLEIVMKFFVGFHQIF